MISQDELHLLEKHVYHFYGMMIAQKRIKESIESDDNCLDLSDLYLEELPDIPPHVISLNCSKNRLKRLPSLHEGLEELICNDNELKELPDFPTTLTHVWCQRNELIRLRYYPTMRYLTCHNNKLVDLPYLEHIPGQYLQADHNDYLWIDKKTAKRRKMKETPNYPLVMKNLKAIYRAQKRLKRLDFRYDLQNHIDYRPGGQGYKELKIKNKGKWFDL